MIASDTSEMTEVGEEAPQVWRVKKQPDGDIYGPVDEATLKEWAAAAQISPEDLVDVSDENWKPAPDYDFLEMVWVVKLPGEELYGPTSIGTLREFIAEGLISDKSVATNVISTQSLPVGALFAALDFEKKRAARRAAPDRNKSTVMIAVDMAKDQRIRQLEEDLRNVRREHEALLHRHRQMQLEMQAVPKIAQQPPPMPKQPRFGR